MKKPASGWPLDPSHPQACAKVRAPLSPAGPTSQMNSSPGIGFAQEAREVATEETTAAEVEEETTAAEVATEEETTAADVALEEEEEEEETTAPDLATEEEVETTTATEKANSVGKHGATKATVVATVSPLPKTSARITVPAHCVYNTVKETTFGQLPSSIIPLYPDISNTLRVDRFSSWKHLVRVTAFVFRAIQNFKKLRRLQLLTVTQQDQPDTTPRSNPPSQFRSLSLLHTVPFLSANSFFSTPLIATRMFCERKQIFIQLPTHLVKSRLIRLKPFLDST